MRSFITAIHFLTCLPVPGKDSRNLSDALPWFALTGGLLGLILCSTLLLPLPQAIVAVLFVAFNTLLTRGLHLDGLADMADAFGGGYTKERRLTILKDTHVGAFAVMALVLALGLKIALLAHFKSQLLFWIPFIYACSRAMQVEAMHALPYARLDGTAKPFMSGLVPMQRWVNHGVWIALALLSGGLAALICGVVAFALTHLLAQYFKRMVGGITGDLIGATSELCELTMLLLIAGVVHAGIV